MPHNKLTELNAWLYFLGSDHPQNILRITEKYPMFCQLYQEIINFRYHQKELIAMYSEVLRIMDQNTISYMADELKDKIQQQNNVISQQDATISQQGAAISQQNAVISQISAEIQHLREELA